MNVTEEVYNSLAMGTATDVEDGVYTVVFDDGTILEFTVEDNAIVDEMVVDSEDVEDVDEVDEDYDDTIVEYVEIAAVCPNCGHTFAVVEE